MGGKVVGNVLVQAEENLKVYNNRYIYKRDMFNSYPPFRAENECHCAVADIQ